MYNNEEIQFDNNSGISIEEQKEILDHINGITEKNKTSLIKKETKNFARKKGFFFPILFNIIALLILAGGLYALFYFNSKKDFEIRTGSGFLELTEQTLIGELTASQEEALAHLQELSSEQERAQGIDAYVSGAMAIISDLILSDEFDLASQRVNELKNFINTPSFELNRFFQPRKEFYIQSINSLEKLIADIRRSGLNVVMALEEKNAELENTVTNLENNLNNLTSSNTEQAGRIVQLQDAVQERDRTISGLQTERNELEHNVSVLRSQNQDNQTEISRLNEQLTSIRAALQALSQ